MTARAILAGLLYAIALFALGFVLGPLRELVLAPRLGAFVATLVEAVPMVAAMAWIAPRIARGRGLPARSGARIGMGLAGLACVMAAELVLARLLRGIGPGAALAHYATPAGLVGAAMLGIFAAMPWMRR